MRFYITDYTSKYSKLNNDNNLILPEKFSNKYEFLIPAIRTLVVKCNDLLDMRYLVPNMPPTNHGPTFYSDFKTFAVSEEWTSFLDKQVYFNFTAHNSYCSACEVLR